MRQLSNIEVHSIRELLQMETNALAKAKATRALVDDSELKKQIDSGILATEGRIRGIQQFINENQIINLPEVH